MDTTSREKLRREYRAFVRTGHPDRGGDPEAFVRGLRHWQELLGTGPAGRPAVPVPGVTAYRLGPWPVRCGRALAAAARRRRRTRVL